MSGVVSAEELSKASAAPAPAEHVFEPVNVLEANKGRKEIRRIPVPPHRFGQLKRHWVEIFTPIVSTLKLQMRMNVKTKQVEIQTSEYTEDIGALQRAADFVKAFLLGFEVKDALALLRMDELYVDSFDVDDVKRLAGDNLSRAIGRIAGKDGRTRVLIENSTRTRIVLADKFASLSLRFLLDCVLSPFSFSLCCVLLQTGVCTFSGASTASALPRTRLSTSSSARPQARWPRPSAPSLPVSRSAGNWRACARVRILPFCHFLLVHTRVSKKPKQKAKARR